MLYLTKQEKAVVLFLAGVFLCGALIRFVLMKQPRLDAALTITPGAAAVGKVNLNKASFEELIRVPYIGEKTARRILDYRQAHGKFATFEELRTLRGIFPASYEVMVKYLRL